MSKQVLLAVGGLGIAGVAAAWYYFHVSASGTTDDGTPTDDSAIDTSDNVVDSVEAIAVGWKSVGEAVAWLPTIASVEQQYDLPTDLLARMAYQESHFRDEIIRGTKASPAGALGIMQLLPKYYESAQAPVPFSDSDVTAQIFDAGKAMADHYSRFNDWSLAIAAYNAGEGNVHKYGGIPPFPETQKYVSDITADVPELA